MCLIFRFMPAVFNNGQSSIISALFESIYITIQYRYIFEAISCFPSVPFGFSHSFVMHINSGGNVPKLRVIQN